MIVCLLSDSVFHKHAFLPKASYFLVFAGISCYQSSYRPQILAFVFCQRMVPLYLTFIVQDPWYGMLILYYSCAVEATSAMETFGYMFMTLQFSLSLPIWINTWTTHCSDDNIVEDNTQKISSDNWFNSDHYQYWATLFYFSHIMRMW